MMQITVLFNGKRQSAFLLDEPNVVIGRGRSAHIALDGNPIVSRQHAAIRQEGDGHILEDLGGANGTIVNDHAVKEIRLKPGDRIVLGKHVLKYEVAGPDAQSLQPQRAPMVAATGLGIPDERSTMRVEPVADPHDAAPNLAARPGPAPTAKKKFEGFAGQERTVSASKEELEAMLEQAKLKAAPHLASQDDEGRVQLIPVTEPPVLIGHTDECRVRLPGSPWFGKVAASIEQEGGKWIVVARSPFWNPVLVGTSKLRVKRALAEGVVLTVKERKFRFSLGEKN